METQSKLKPYYKFINDYGLPINCSYVSHEKIWEEVKVTDIHMKADVNTSIFLSVAVIGYENNIFSVWVYIGLGNNGYNNKFQ